MKSSKLFSEYFLKAYRLSGFENLTTGILKPQELLVKDRFDLACKIFYIECREKQQDLELAKKLYAEHIRCITYNTFMEPDSSSKNCLEDFFNEFDNLIDSIKTNGFDTNKSIVPVGSNSSILNGSHRVAVCYYFGIDVPVVFIDNYYESYDYNFFKSQGMDEECLDLIAALFVKYCKNAYIGFLWPSVYEHQLKPAADILINKTVSVFYKKELNISFRGLVQLMMQLYGEQEWTGGFSGEFKGVIQKALNCYCESNTVIYLICNQQLDLIVNLKELCRNFFNIGNHSLHFTDTKDEATMASEIVFNKNSIALLNRGYIFNNTKFIDLCSGFSEYYTFCSISSDISSGFFSTNNQITTNNISLTTINDSIYSNWFDSFYCFGKRMLLPEHIQDSNSPYEIVWKNEKKARQMGEFKNTNFYKLTRIPTRMIKRILRKTKRIIIKIFKRPKRVNNIEKAFKKLKKNNCNYLVMRNYENFFDDLLIPGHNDIDVLVYSSNDRKLFLKIFKAVPRWGLDDGHAYKFLWRKEWVELDIRMVGDNYYDANWQINMLNNKIMTGNGYFVMCCIDYKYSLAYHGYYQKKLISPDYIIKFQKWFGSDSNSNFIKEDLRNFMISNGYYYCYPKDSSVQCYFDDYCNGLISN